VVGELVGSNTRQPAVVVPVAGLAMATLAWRRAAPTTVAVVVLLASLLMSLTAQGEFPPQLPFVADLLAVYTAASCLAGRRAWVAGALTLALVWVSHSVTGDGDPGDFLPALVWGAPWAAGRLVRRRLLEAAQVATDAALAVQQHDDQLREAAARERDRIARELHDVVAHGVSLMVVQAGAERLRLGADAPQTRDVLDDIERAGRTALGELRTMLAVLRAADGAEVTARTPQPTLTDLPELVERVRDAGVTVQLDADLAADVPATVGLSAYRIVQEALTNALKHAPGRPATVSVYRDADRLLIEVTSPLPAVPAQADGPGRGLVGMSERAALHGGTVSSGPDGGCWRVVASLPLAAPLPRDPVSA
jgi:signal transduction histidine kinase